MAFLPVRFSASETVISIFFAKQSSIFLEEENKDSCNISHTRQRPLTLLPLLPHHIHLNKTGLYRIKALARLCFIPVFCITFANENKKPASVKKENQQNLQIDKNHQEPGEQEGKIFFLTGNKVTFSKKKSKQTSQPQYFLPKHFPTPGEFLLRAPGIHLSPFTGNRIHPDWDGFYLISQRRIVIFYTLVSRNQSGPHTHPRKAMLNWKGGGLFGKFKGEEEDKLRRYLINSNSDLAPGMRADRAQSPVTPSTMELEGKAPSSEGRAAQRCP